MGEMRKVIKPEEVERLSKREYMELIEEVGAEIREKAVKFLEKTVIKPLNDDMIENIVCLEPSGKDPYEIYTDIICDSCRFEECCNEDFYPRPCDKMFDKWRVQISIKLIPPEK